MLDLGRRILLLKFYAFLSLVSISQPTISSFSPQSGQIGSTVIITGNNFASDPSGNIVKFGRIKANVVSATSTSLSVKVPVGATFHPITVTTNYLIATSQQPFRVSFGDQLTLDSNSFAPRENFHWISPTGFIDGPRGLEPIDVNDDGKIDLVAKDGRSYQIGSVLRNQSTNGSITYGNPSLSFLWGKNSLNVFDYNGDGLDDIGYTEDRSNGTGGAAISLNQGANAATHFGGSAGWGFDAPGTVLTSWGSTGADFDSDGRIDFAAVFNGNYQISIRRNTTSPGGTIDFGTFTSIVPDGLIPNSIASGDLDGDQKPDLAVTDVFGGRVFIYANSTLGQFISFNSPIELTYQLAGNDQIRDIEIADIDQDGRNDIVSLVDSRLYVRRNTATSGVLSFADPLVIATIPQNRGIAIGDLNGDGKPELGVVGVFIPNFKSYIQLFQNNSTPGFLSFSPAIFLPSNFYVTGIAFADCNNDGLPDIATSNIYDQEARTVSIYKNLLGAKRELCSAGSQTLTSSIEGASYQWQLDSGNGFDNLSDNGNYNGYNASTLNIIGLNTSAYGFKFRCIVDGIVGPEHWLKFINTWTGATSNAWENTANWSCGTLPDANTDVTISSGNVIINSNVTIRTLTIAPGAAITVQPGFTLTITH